MSTDKPHYNYESAYGGKQEVELMISAYTMNDNLYVGLKGVDPDGSTFHYADLTVNIPSAAPLEPFRSAIDIEHLGQLDAMNFLSESGLANHTGEYLPSGYMTFPVYEFDAGKLAEADPQGFKDYLKIVGLDEKQIGENSVEDLAAMVKARFHEKTAGEEPALPSDERPEFQFGEKVELPFGEGSPMGSFEQVLEALRDDDLIEDDEDDFERPPISDADLPDTGKPFLDYDTSYGAIGSFTKCTNINDAPEERPNPSVPSSVLPAMGKPFFDYRTSYGETERVSLILGTYDYESNIYVGLDFYDHDIGGVDFYGDLTVNITKLQPFMACVDTNNNNAEKITAFLTENGFAEPAGRALPSGFCMYPVFRFNPEKLREADPIGFARYCREAGIGVESLKAPQGSLDEAKRQARERAQERNAERLRRPQKDSCLDL